jgi:hypothetical protein
MEVIMLSFDFTMGRLDFVEKEEGSVKGRRKWFTYLLICQDIHRMRFTLTKDITSHNPCKHDLLK